MKAFFKVAITVHLEDFDSPSLDELSESDRMAEEARRRRSSYSLASYLSAEDIASVDPEHAKASLKWLTAEILADLMEMERRNDDHALNTLAEAEIHRRQPKADKST